MQSKRDKERPDRTYLPTKDIRVFCASRTRAHKVNCASVIVAICAGEVITTAQA